MKIKNGKQKTIGVIALIRGCKGLVIETLTSQPERTDLIKVIKEFDEDPMYYVYGLRHRDNDWTEPFTVEKTSVLANRFGWFITKDEMKFPTGKNDVELSRKNAKYFECIAYDPDIQLSPRDHVFYAKPLTVTHYVNDEDEIRDEIDNHK